MQIYSDDEIKPTLEQLLAGLEVECAIVDINKQDDFGIRQTASGMDVALSLIRQHPDLSIVMLGWMTDEQYAKDARWAEIKKSSRVAFRRMPPSKDDILSALEEINKRIHHG